MEDRIEKWRNDWLSAQRKSIPTWGELAKRQGTAGTSEQNFWRVQSSSYGPMSDEQLIEMGLLHAVEKNKFYHSAYLPWIIGKGNGKKDWSFGQWDSLSSFISQKYSENPYEFEQFEWSNLCIRSQDLNFFARFGLRNSHVIGDVELNGSNKNISSNFFDGNISGVPSKIDECCIAGSIWIPSDCKINKSKIGTAIYNGSSSNGEIEISNSDIKMLKCLTIIRDLRINNSEIEFADLSNIEILKLEFYSENSNSAVINFGESNAKGRVNLLGYRFSNSDNFEIQGSDNEKFPFEHSKFEQKFRIIDCDFRISDLANIQVSSLVDIEFHDKNIEDVFERELTCILSAKKNFPDRSEDRRRRLERACQILCERHRQDGRKDLEHRFRRMEIKARSYRSGAEWDTKVVSWVYSKFSDFGRSFSRPIIGLFLIMFVFSIFYWGAGALALGQTQADGAIVWATFGEAFLLGVDKTFPFGASIDEAELFNGKLVGEKAGGFAFLVGLVGAIQTILSGIMVFFAGLAVRTKLLIG